MSSRPDPNASLSDFFKKKWSVQIAYKIGNSGASYTSLENDLGISSSVLSRRLKTGEYLGLWTTIAKRSGESRSKQKYVVTQNGLTILHLLQETGVPPAYKTLEDSREQFLRARTDFLDAIEEHKDAGDLAPPWEESPEPTAEARESINALNLPESVKNPLSHAVSSGGEKDVADSEEGESTSESDIQSLLETVIAAYPEDISEEELHRVLQTEQHEADPKDEHSN